MDLRTACGGCARLAISALTSAVTLLGGHLAHADFSDGESAAAVQSRARAPPSHHRCLCPADNANWAPEGLAGLAFAWTPDPALLPGVRWAYDRALGAGASNQTWDRQSSGTIWGLLYYRDDVEAADPATLPAWQAAFDDSAGNGKFVWRSGYGYDSDGGDTDVVAAIYAKLRGGAGHEAPDALGVRLVGRNGSWVIGGGRYGLDCAGLDCYLRSQSTLYPADPDAPAAALSGINTRGACSLAGLAPVSSTLAGGAVGGAASATCGAASNTGVGGHTRRVAVRLDAGGGSGAGVAPGVAAALVVVDSSVNGTWAQWMTLGANAVSPAPGVPQAWDIAAPGGGAAAARLTLLFPPAGVAFAVGPRPRAQPYLVLDGLYPNGTFVKAAAAASGGASNWVWALTVVAPGHPQPPARAAGEWGGAGASLRGNVTVGAWTVSVDGDAIVG